MDQERMTELLKGFKSSPETMEKLQVILQGSAESLQLLKGFQTASPEDKELAQKAFLKKQQEVAGEYEKLLADMGLTKEMLEGYAADPKNFSPESWEYLESFKKEMAKETKLLTDGAKEGGKVVKKSKPIAKSQWMSA